MKFFVSVIAVAFAVVLSTIADVFLKKSQLSNFNYVCLGVLFYALGALPVALAFKLVDFSLVFFIWEVIAVILGLGLGIFLFKEQFSVLKFVVLISAIITLVLSYIAYK